MEFLSELFGQFVQSSPSASGGWNIHLSTPDRIELTKQQALVLWGMLHFAYAFLSHWRSLVQVRRYNKTAEQDKQVRDGDNFVFFLARMLVGLEFKIFNILQVFVARIYCNLVAPIISAAGVPVFGRVCRHGKGLKRWLTDHSLYKLRWTSDPEEMRL